MHHISPRVCLSVFISRIYTLDLALAHRDLQPAVYNVPFPKDVSIPSI